MKQIIGFFLVVFMISLALVVGFCEEIMVSNEVEFHPIKPTIEITATFTPEPETPTPTEEVTPEPTLTPEPTPTQTPWNISIKIEVREQTYSLGDRVTLVSYVTGAEGLKCQYQWQQEINNEWVDVEGYGETYAFILTEISSSCRWRLALTVTE